jgi:hypothetical protein
MIKKLFITSIIIYLGLILLTCSPFQANNLFQDKTNTSVNDNIQSVYAQKNGDDNDDDNGKDDNDDDDDDNGKDDANENVVKTSLDEGNIPVTNIATSQNESLLSFSPSVGNTTTPALLQPDNQLVDKPSPSTILRN